jgi:SAM-dependent methyltransferase
MEFLLRIKTFWYNLKSFITRKVLFTISPDELVLDVGSGDKPFWRADVIVDKDVVDDKQRGTRKMLFDKRKYFVQADVENLPFKDKAFDFVFCSHLLEHVLHPDRAIKELTRVAKRGYIEVPGAIGDLLLPFPVHLWYCDYQNGVLLFYQKSNVLSFHQEIIKKFGTSIVKSPAFEYIIAKHPSYYQQILWNKSIKYKIIRVPQPYAYKYSPETYYSKTSSKKLIFNPYHLFYIVMTKLFYKKKHIVIDLLLKHDKK